MQEGPLLFTCPALTALDLVAEMNKGEPIDVALRKQAASLDEMHAAFAALRNRRGNSGRGLMLADSRDEPWSEAERRLHRLMRAAGISNWKPNLTHWVTEKKHYFLDIAFKRLKIVIEVDGYEFHTQHAVFETDRDRQNRLVLEGWLVLRFTWKMIVETPEGVIATIRQAIALRESLAR